MFLVTYPTTKYILEPYEATFFKKTTFTYVLLFISINFEYGLIFVLVYSVYSKFGLLGETSKKLFTLRKVCFLVVFKLSPFIQLFISFFGEYLAIYMSPMAILVFCSIYPFLMGLVQKVTSLIDREEDFKLDMFAEVYSLFYASLPYKLVYLGLDSLWMGFAVLGIKTVFKLTVYVILPWRKHYKASHGICKVDPLAPPPLDPTDQIGGSGSSFGVNDK